MLALLSSAIAGGDHHDSDPKIKTTKMLTSSGAEPVSKTNDNSIEAKKVEDDD